MTNAIAEAPVTSPNPPPGWPVYMAWPPPPEVVEAAQRAKQGDRQMRLFGRPAFVIDGVALTLIVELTGHADLVRRPPPKVFAGVDMGKEPDASVIQAVHP